MYKTYAVIFAFILTALLFTACNKSSPGCGWGPGKCDPITYSCVGITPKFAADVFPIITTVCATNASCHAAGSTNAGGPFTNYNQIFAKRLIMKDQILLGKMPQAGSISQEQINAVICWIDSGAPNN